MVTGTAMSITGSYASFNNTVYGTTNIETDYIYNNSKALALFYAGNVRTMILAEGATVDATVNDRDIFE